MAFDARVALLLLLSGCPAARSDAPAASAGEVEPAVEEARGRPYVLVRQWTDHDLRMALPDGWTARAGEGDVLLEALGPEGSGIRLTVSRWSGDPAALEGIRATPTGWVSSGPYGRPARIADAPPHVHSRPADPAGRELEQGWHFVVRGRGYSIVALLPRVGFEGALDQVRPILDSLEVAAP